MDTSGGNLAVSAQQSADWAELARQAESLQTIIDPDMLGEHDELLLCARRIRELVAKLSPPGIDELS